MKLLLFGGSFDPIHRGHLALAAAAVLTLGMERVVFLPAKQNPLKETSPVASDEQRLRWLQLATAGIVWAEVNGVELERAEPSYSWKTVEWAQQTWPQAQLHWLIGEDQWQQLDAWKRIEWLDKQLTWVVGSRGGNLAQQLLLHKKRRSLLLEGFDHPANSTTIREQGLEFQGRGWLPALIAQEICRSSVYGLVD